MRSHYLAAWYKITNCCTPAEKHKLDHKSQYSSIRYQHSGNRKSGYHAVVSVREKKIIKWCNWLCELKEPHAQYLMLEKWYSKQTYTENLTVLHFLYIKWNELILFSEICALWLTYILSMYDGCMIFKYYIYYIYFVYLESSFSLLLML